jgi:hypothetical protein
LGLFICWVIILHHMQSLANVTMATIATGNVGKLVLPRTSCFHLLATNVRHTNRQKIYVLFAVVLLKKGCKLHTH